MPIVVRQARFVLLGLLLCGAGPAPALINPHFTPVHLVRGAAVIARLRVRDARGGEISFQVEERLKGALDSDLLATTLVGRAPTAQASAAAQLATRAADRSALLFIGELPEKPLDLGEGDPGAGFFAEGGAEPMRAFIHLGGYWLVFVRETDGRWLFLELSQALMATWSGGTDMLLRAVRHLLRDESADIPVRTGTHWAAVLSGGKVPGRIAALKPVALGPGNRLLAHVCSDAGDRMLEATEGAIRDITASLAIATASRIAEWGDFDNDGRLDLASWDGKTLGIALQSAEGHFARPMTVAGVTECRGLSAIAAGGRTGLLVSTNGPPLLWQGGQAHPIGGSAAWPGQALGRAGACLVADFTGNGCLDILQPCERGSLLYRGQSAGLFAPPEACAIMLPHPKGAAFLGDWDADGQFDVCVTAPAGVALWHNYGDGRFAESVMLAGELGYVSKPNATGGATCDLNGDGRQDMMILYSGIKPQIFFNRGFRSFGFSISMDTDRLEALAGARAGQQAGCVADFFGDGTPSMALALPNGECLFVRRAALGGEYWLQAAPLTAAPGPVRIWARGAGRDLGAWSAAAGAAPAFICLPEAGPLKVFWQHPNGPVQSKELVLERGLRLALETAGKR